MEVYIAAGRYLLAGKAVYGLVIGDHSGVREL